MGIKLDKFLVSFKWIELLRRYVIKLWKRFCSKRYYISIYTYARANKVEVMQQHKNSIWEKSVKNIRLLLSTNSKWLIAWNVNRCLKQIDRLEYFGRSLNDFSNGLETVFIFEKFCTSSQFMLAFIRFLYILNIDELWEKENCCYQESLL